MSLDNLNIIKRLQHSVATDLKLILVKYFIIIYVKMLVTIHHMHEDGRQIIIFYVHLNLVL